METIQEMTDEDSRGMGGRKARKPLVEETSVRGAADTGSVDRRQERGSQRHQNVHKRTAMGDYIVPKGGKPLTQQTAFPTPGPNVYLPSHRLTQRACPQYSIVGRSKDFGANKLAPAPADYDTSRDLIWRDKRVTLKRKGKTMITDYTNTIGPAQYNVRYLNTGKHAPKPSISSRHKDGTNVGHPSNVLARSTSTKPDYPIPGPNAYSPKVTCRGTHKSFGVLYPRGGIHHDGSLLGPGPAAYNVKEPSTKPGYTLGKRLKPQWQNAPDSPAPNSYNVGSKIGKGLAMSIRSRQPLVEKTFGPSPNSYFLRDCIKNSDASSATITYRPFEMDGSHEKPGPTHYHITDKTKRNAPRYSFRGNRKCPLPQPEPEDTPAPGTYHRPRVFTTNDSPAYTMGLRTKTLSSAPADVPGPNHYHIVLAQQPHRKKAPSFTISGWSNRPDKGEQDSPAPTAYSPKIVTNGGPKYSMTSRRVCKEWNGHPAPNSYNILTNQTAKGRYNGSIATLKGRSTPFVYLGYAFQNSVRLRDA